MSFDQQVSIQALHYETMQPVRIDITGGIISNIEVTGKCGEGLELPIVAPGLIDNQVNGYAGVDFSGDGLTSEGIVKATKSLWATGVTTYLPTLITNSREKLIGSFEILASAVSNPEISPSVPGFHLEGPYLSKLEGFRGCHPEEHLKNPDLEEFKTFQTAAGGRIVQITLAPELPGSNELIQYCSANGIIAAIGHTNARSNVIETACNNGVRLSTHLGNGCANLIHRHLNPIWPQLAQKDLKASLIADGHHLLPEELTVFLKAKGAENIILTSDITYLAGMPAGIYQFGGAAVVLTADGMLKSFAQDCLAGATLPLMKGVENMIRFTGCTLSDAVNMASRNVAKLYGWNDRGELLPGRRADLILLKKSESDLILQQSFIAGKRILDIT